MYGYNAKPPIAIPIYTVLPYCVINRNSFVYGCFLDASMGFNHELLFSYLLVRGVLPTITRFLRYKHQTNGVLCESFHVSNGVRQGGVLSPVCVY